MMYDNELESIFDYASREGIEDIEVLLQAGRTFSVRVHQQEIEEFKYADSRGIGVRVVQDNKEGYAYTERLDIDSLSMIVDEAVSSCRYVESEDPVTLAAHPSVDAGLALYSEKLETVTVDQKIDTAMRLESLARARDKRVVNVPQAVMGDSVSYSRVANSRGLDKKEQRNYAYAYVGVLTQENNEKRSGMEFVQTRDFDQIDPDDLSAKSVAKGVNLLNGRGLAPGSSPVVLNNEAMASLLSAFSAVFSAKSVQEGRSLLKGRLGEAVGNPVVSVIDNGLHPDGFSTSAFDAEGFPSQRTALVQDGILKSYLHNTTTASNDCVASTGNAARGYKGSLVVSPTNLYLEPGPAREADLFKRHESAIEVVSVQGLHAGANAVSGDFSLLAEGFLYQQGKRLHSLKPFTISGNILQLLHDVELVADNFRFNMSSIGSPSVLVRSLSVSG